MRIRWSAVIAGVLLSSGSAEAEPIDLDPKLIESSPVLQQWLKQVPDVSADIVNDPSFRTRYRIEVGRIRDRTHLSIGVEDLRIAQTRMTVSADYRASNWGANLQYYVRPLGSYFNVAPVVGYRHIETQNRTVEGANIGVRALFALSRGGGADIALTQTWVSPLSAKETGLTTLSLGYAVTRNLRIATDFQKANSRDRKESRIGISLEWMP